MRKLILLLALLSALALTSCRARTGLDGSALQAEGGQGGAAASAADIGAEAASDTAGAVDEEAEPLWENPASRRREYDETATAEVRSDAEGQIHRPGEGPGLPDESAEASASVSRLSDSAEKTAVEKETVTEADRLGVSTDAPEASSALHYYQTLLADRLESLLECKRVYAYLETERDFVTVSRHSAEHELLIDAGVYDVAARLTEDRLAVDSGWISRKNPDLIVKLVDSSVLGPGLLTDSAAEAKRDALLAREGLADTEAVRAGRAVLIPSAALETPWLRIAALLAIAKTAYPELMADVVLEDAVGQLREEALAESGVWLFTGR